MTCRETSSLDGGEKDLTMHDGTVRDCCFVEEGSGGSTLLLSGGAGDCKVYVTDCRTFTPFQVRNFKIIFKQMLMDDIIDMHTFQIIIKKITLSVEQVKQMVRNYNIANLIQHSSRLNQIILGTQSFKNYKCIVRGVNGLFNTLFPKVLQYRFLIRWLNKFGDLS